MVIEGETKQLCAQHRAGLQIDGRLCLKTRDLISRFLRWDQVGG